MRAIRAAISAFGDVLLHLAAASRRWRSSSLIRYLGGVHGVAA
jgi:hypothetical protein